MKLPTLGSMLPWRKRAAEGAYRPGPYYIQGIRDEGWLSAKEGRAWNWWQMGSRLKPFSGCGAMVEACVSAYAQTVAMCPGSHWRALPNGGRERVTNSALARVLKTPNDYQSISDFKLNLARNLCTIGEAFVVTIRNGRYEPDELHLMRHGWPYIAADGSIFYSLQGNPIAESRYDLTMPIPARDVMHLRLHTPRHPLRGESPIVAAALELELSGAALSQQVAFYLNQARPSFILETDQQLSKEQAKDLRERWEAQTTGANAGGTPILAWGLKAKPVTVGAADTQLAEMLRMSDQNVAIAYRIPLQILGISGTATYASTEALMSSWKAMGLGFFLNHIEEGFDRLFGLAGYPDEYVEFDTDALLRSNFKEMIEGLALASHRGMTINEVRHKLDLPDITGGDELLIQMQDIPLSMAGQATSAQAPKGPAPTNDNGARADAESVVRAYRAARARELAV